MGSNMLQGRPRERLGAFQGLSAFLQYPLMSTLKSFASVSATGLITRLTYYREPFLRTVNKRLPEALRVRAGAAGAHTARAHGVRVPGSGETEPDSGEHLLVCAGDLHRRQARDFRGEGRAWCIPPARPERGGSPRGRRARRGASSVPAPARARPAPGIGSWQERRPSEPAAFLRCVVGWRRG